MVFVCHEKQFPGGVPGLDPRGSKWQVYKTIEFMFAGINMFGARLRLILARAVRLVIIIYSLPTFPERMNT